MRLAAAHARRVTASMMPHAAESCSALAWSKRTGAQVSFLVSLYAEAHPSMLHLPAPALSQS